jgi:hypothetical protein
VNISAINKFFLPKRIANVVIKPNSLGIDILDQAKIQVCINSHGGKRHMLTDITPL